MGCHRGCAGRRDVWAVLGHSVVHGMLQELCLVEGCVGCLVVRGMRWGSLLCGAVCGTLGCAGGSGSVLCGGLWGGAVGCGTGVIYAALRCVEVPSEVLRKRTVLGGLQRWL